MLAHSSRRLSVVGAPLGCREAASFKAMLNPGLWGTVAVCQVDQGTESHCGDQDTKDRSREVGKHPELQVMNGKFRLKAVKMCPREGGSRD